jgi:DtxR family Mn-dependent transcriptional regulator
MRRSERTAMPIQLTSDAENYLKCLYGGEIEDDPLPQETPDDRVVGELLRHALVRPSDGTYHLTKEGRQQAENAVRRHRLAERLLHDVINVHGQQVDTSACEVEHSLHHGVDSHICALLGHPKTCPHGRPIPPGRCCRERRGPGHAIVTPLSGMKAGERGVIAYLSSHHSHTVQKLMALGALPGSPVAVMQTFPSIVFQVGQTQIAVDHQLAGDIFVRRTGESE